MMADNPFEILCVSKDASPEQIHDAYKRLVKELHPDKYSDSPYRSQKEERLKQVNSAYDRLKMSFPADANEKRTEEDTKRKSAAAEKHRAADAAKHRATEQPRGSGKGDAEAAAARFWAAFRKAEQEVK
jgi:curved DNA-binding protein CbpA